MSEVSQKLKNCLLENKDVLKSLFSEKRWARILSLMTELSKSFITLEPCSYDRFPDLLPLTDDVSKLYNINYVNASFINLGSEESYIACQLPKKEHLADFIRFLGKANPAFILSLDGSYDYLEKYKEFMVFSYTIKYGKKDFLTYEFYDIYGKTIGILKLNSWEDHSVISLDEMEFLDSQVSKYLSSKLIIVHCKAGVGRTGTFILYRELRKLGRVTENDFIDKLIELRSQRPGMVYEWEQLEFLYTSFIN